MSDCCIYDGELDRLLIYGTTLTVNITCVAAHAERKDMQLDFMTYLR